MHIIVLRTWTATTYPETRRKGKFVMKHHAIKAGGVWRHSSTVIDLNIRDEWSGSRLDRFISWERAPDIRCRGGRADPRAVIDSVEDINISCLCRESSQGRDTP
jgi:hypothetical protein